METGKTGKYFKYAIGEIVLVVIGILIALSINNWNEDRKAKNKTKHLLTKVHKELAFNINEANSVVRAYRYKDSIVYKVLNKKVTYHDYKTNPRYSSVIMGTPTAELKDNAFKNLMNHEVSFTSQEDTIISKLIDLYEKNKRTVDTRNELALSRLQKSVSKTKDVYPWYYDYHVKKEYIDAMVNYYLNDPIYLNDVTDYSMKNLNGHNGAVLNFRNKALKLYKELSSYLNIKQDSTIVKNLSNFEHYMGVYRDSLDVIEVTKEKDNFIYTRRNTIDSTDVAKYILYPDSNAYFNVARLFGKLTFRNNEVKELILSQGHYRKVYKKVN